MYPINNKEPAKKFVHGYVHEDIEEIKKKENSLRRQKPKNFLEEILIKAQRKDIYLKEREKKKNRKIKHERYYKMY